ncbi:MAG: tyrosine-type recombinase/integrase [Archangium sp.]
MASVFKRNDVWVVKWKNAAGNWRQERTRCATKAAAKLYAAQLEHRAELQRHGLQPLDAPSAMTFGELLTWYDQHHAHRVKSPSRRLTAGKHLAELERLPLVEITTARLELLFNAKLKDLSAETVNGIRAFTHRLFTLAHRGGLWALANPVSAVPRVKVPKRPPSWLRPEEVDAVIPEVPAPWRAMFATAVFTGMRRGELVALQKRDVSLDDARPVITVCRSWDSDSTKGKEVRQVPVHPQLVPYLRSAIACSPSELVFPRADGTMHHEDINLPAMLRSAMARAGLVRGWIHKCRWCSYRSEMVGDAHVRRCPHSKCGKKLWPSPVHRPERFHDLRHTTATLLLKLGTPLAMVQRLVGHADPAITTEVYGHLEVEDVRPHLERLPFQLAEPEVEVLPAVANGSRGAPVVHGRADDLISRGTHESKTQEARAVAKLSESEKNKGPVPRPSPCGCCTLLSTSQAALTF